MRSPFGIRDVFDVSDGGRDLITECAQILRGKPRDLTALEHYVARRRRYWQARTHPVAVTVYTRALMGGLRSTHPLGYALRASTWS